MEYLPSEEACKRLGVHINTLRNWANAGKIDYIRTGGNQRRYNVDGFLKEAKQRAAEDHRDKHQAA